MSVFRTLKQRGRSLLSPSRPTPASTRADHCTRLKAHQGLRCRLDGLEIAIGFSYRKVLNAMHDRW